MATTKAMTAIDRQASKVTENAPLFPLPTFTPLFPSLFFPLSPTPSLFTLLVAISVSFSKVPKAAIEAVNADAQ